MVSLALSHPYVSVPDQFTTAQLRNLAVWYPSAPPPTVNLNATTFPHASSHFKTYDPLFCFSFAGPDGSCLETLLRVEAWCTQGIHHLVFRYAGNGSPQGAGSEELGHRDSEARHRPGRTWSNFIINGPAGERITGVDVYELQDDEDPPLVCGLRLHTNFGRSGLLCGDQSKLSGHDIAVTSTMHEDAAITGFYASRCYREGLTSLGVISEQLAPQSEEGNVFEH